MKWLQICQGRAFSFRLGPKIFFSLLGVAFILSCSGGEGGKLTTRARLQNLKVTMVLITQMTMQGDMTFPQKIPEIQEFMEREMGETGDLFVDGWGQEMRFQGDLWGYEIRSAGRDRLFDTDDDIVLQGNEDGEYILDGSESAVLTKESFARQINKLPFQEPNGYYQVQLPGKYAVIPDYDGTLSSITFAYAKDMRVTIEAEPSDRIWNPEPEMRKKLEALRRSEDENFSDFTVTRYGLVTLAKAPGYEITYEFENILAQEIMVMSHFGLFVHVTLVASGPDRQAILNILANALKQSLEIQF